MKDCPLPLLQEEDNILPGRHGNSSRESAGVEPSCTRPEDARGGSSKSCSNLFLAGFNESPEHFTVKRRKKSLKPQPTDFANPNSNHLKRYNGDTVGYDALNFKRAGLNRPPWGFNGM